jgi:hypothetical protein
VFIHINLCSQFCCYFISYSSPPIISTYDKLHNKLSQGLLTDHQIFSIIFGKIYSNIFTYFCSVNVDDLDTLIVHKIHLSQLQNENDSNSKNRSKIFFSQCESFAALNLQRLTRLMIHRTES